MFTPGTGWQEGNVTFTVAYSPTGFPNDVVLDAQVSAIPEPASLFLFAIGIAGIGVYTARRPRQVAWEPRAIVKLPAGARGRGPAGLRCWASRNLSKSMTSSVRW